MNHSDLVTRLRNNPWPASLLALLVYGAWFLVPLLFARPQAQPATPSPAPSEIEHLLDQIPNQIGLVLLLTGIVALQVGGVSIQPLQVFPGLLYGSFVMWRWFVRSETFQPKG